MNHISSIIFPLDESRFFIEITKFNKETLLRNFFSPSYRDRIETDLKKGLVSFVSPYLSGLLIILVKNSQDIYQSLSDTYFFSNFFKEYLTENFTLIGRGLFKHLLYITWDDRDLKIFKNDLISTTLFHFRHGVERGVEKVDFELLKSKGIDFLLYSKFILLEMNHICDKNNPVLFYWVSQFLKFIINKKMTRQKNILLL